MTIQDKNRQPAPRHPQLDLLRVLCMLGIVLNHFFTYGLDIYGLRGEPLRLPVLDPGDALNWGVLQLIKLVSLVSVNCFVLISGYFLVSDFGFRMAGVRRVWLHTVFYGTVIFGVLAAARVVPFSFVRLFKFFLPVCTNQYWFVTTYLALMCLAPFLARLASGMGRRTYGFLLLAGFCICLQYPLGRMFVDSQQLTLFVYLFMVGGYIRRFGGEHTMFTSHCLEIALFCFVAMFALVLGKNLIRESADGFCIYAMAYHSPVMPCSIALFMAFARRRSSSALVRLFSAPVPHVFAVYLIHSHPMLQEVIWDAVGRYCLARPQWLLAFYGIGISLLIFVCCILVDWLRSIFWKD